MPRQGHGSSFGREDSVRSDNNLEQIDAPSQGKSIAPSEGVVYASSEGDVELPPIGVNQNINLSNVINSLHNHSLNGMKDIVDRDVLYVRIIEVVLITLGVLGIIGNILVFCGLRNDKKSTSTTY